MSTEQLGAAVCRVGVGVHNAARQLDQLANVPHQQRAPCRALMDAATTDACLDILDAAGLKTTVMASLLQAVQLHLERRAAGAFTVGAVLFSNQSGPLGQTTQAKTLLQSWKGN